MRSIRRDLVIRILGGTVLLLVVVSVFLGVVIRRLDIREFDSSLETKARTLATLVLLGGRRIEVDFAGEYMPEFERSKDPEYFQFRLPDGSVIERSDMLGDLDLPFLPITAEAPTIVDLRLPDGRRGRLVQIAFPPRTEVGEGAQGVKRTKIAFSFRRASIRHRYPSFWRLRAVERIWTAYSSLSMWTLRQRTFFSSP